MMTEAGRFWDGIYDDLRVKVPEPDDPILNAALRHFGDVRGARLLDLGCGAGEASLFFAERGASVVSLDTSENAIANLEEFCARRGIEGIRPLVLPASEIKDLGPFDFVFGAFILHHIEPFAEFAELLRDSLSPQGRAFFHENNSSNPVLMWFRRNVVGRFWIPKHGDDEEHPLSPEEIDELRNFFDVSVKYPELLLFRLVSSYFLKERMMRPFEILDEALYRFPTLRPYSYRQDILLS